MMLMVEVVIKWWGSLKEDGLAKTEGKMEQMNKVNFEGQRRNQQKGKELR